MPRSCHECSMSLDVTRMYWVENKEGSRLMCPDCSEKYELTYAVFPAASEKQTLEKKLSEAGDELLARANHIKSLETSQAIDREAYQRLANENELLRVEAAGEKRLKEILEDGFHKLAKQKDRVEAENKRLTMLLEEAERNCFSDSD